MQGSKDYYVNSGTQRSLSAAEPGGAPVHCSREYILRRAEECVCSDREAQYGSPEDSFGAIASLWSAYLGRNISPTDVAVMMVLFKMGRVKTGRFKADSWIDAAGYCACGAEVQAYTEEAKNYDNG